MRTHVFGRTRKQVAVVGQGTWQMEGDDRDGCVRALLRGLELGMTHVDTAELYGRTKVEERIVAEVLRGRRDQIFLVSKVRPDNATRFGTVEACEASLRRLGTDHLDIVLCHDIEFVPMQQIVDETLPALRKLQQSGKVRYLGFSGYPMKIFKFILEQARVDCVLSYNQFTLQNTRFADEIVPYLGAKGVGAMNAGPFSARLLTNAPLPAWLKEPENVKAAARAAAALCASRGVDIAKLALQFSLSHPTIATTVAGSANPQNIRNWAKWAAEPIDRQLLAEVQAIFAPVKNIGHKEGLAENN